MARPITSPELTLLRTGGQGSVLRAAFYEPDTVYTARVNQSFSTKDKVLQVTYDTGSGTLANVKAGMTMLVGSSAGASDKGIVRIRKAPTSSIFYIGEESDVDWSDNLYLTVIADFDLWAKHITLSGSTVLIDGDVSYSNQHSSFDPVPIMGSHRILKLTGATVSTSYDWSDSWVYGSSISSYACSAPTASSSSGMATATPTITFDTPGWHIIYLTVTAANGKSFTGVRLVYVEDPDNPPPSVQLSQNPSVDFETGGWSFGLNMYSNTDLVTIRDRTLVILYSDDWYGDTAQSIGPLEGCKNIICIGRIAGETISPHPEQGRIEFSVHGSHHWFNQMKGFPSGLQMVTGAPTTWLQMQNLTVDKALFHFLHWRTTATKIMDVQLTGDERLLSEASSLGAKLWGQMMEVAFNTILANIGVDRFGRVFALIDPQMIPVADRSSIPTVMTITKKDYVAGTLDIPRIVVPDTGLVDLSGVSVNSAAHGKSFFSLAPGHVMMRFGDEAIIDHLAAFDTQAENNQLAGLLLGWRANELPEISMELSANNRMFDCFPLQYAQMTINAGDTPRGISYSGKLIPRYVSFKHDPETGFFNTEITFEAATFPTNYTNGDIPFGPEDPSDPADPDYPDLPIDDIIIIPGFPSGSGNGPRRVLMHDINYGMVYSENFDEDDGANVKWAFVNPGLLDPVQRNSINIFFVTPNGAFYVAYTDVVDSGNYLSKPFFIGRAPSIGATFEIVMQESDIRPSPVGGQWGLFGVARNPLVSEQVAFVSGVVGVDKKIHVGSGSSFSNGADVDIADLRLGGLSYGQNGWLFTRLNAYTRISLTGGSILGTGTPAIDALDIFAPFLGHVRASTTGRTFHLIAGGGGYVVADGDLTTLNPIVDSSFDGTGFASAPDGMYLMTRYGPGGKGRSSDGGATFGAIPSLPPGPWWFDYAGSAGSTSRWVAAGGSSVRYSPDFGDTWLNKEGNLSQLIPVPNIDGIKVVEY